MDVPERSLPLELRRVEADNFVQLPSDVLNPKVPGRVQICEKCPGSVN